MIIKSLLSYTITQIACGETFSLFVTDHNELLVTGLLEVPESEYDTYKTSLSIPHKVSFDKEIIQIAAGTRFALVLYIICSYDQLLVKTKHNNDVYYWKAEENQSGLQVGFSVLVLARNLFLYHSYRLCTSRMWLVVRLIVLYIVQ